MERDLRWQVGQKLAVGFPGTEVPQALRELVAEYKIGNIILFEENIRDAAQLRRLCGELRTLIATHTGLPPLISMDQEGGVVSRLKGDCALAPSAMGVAATGDPVNAHRAGEITGRELRALGVNFDLAPVMDVNSNPRNPVIGARSYGARPEDVCDYGTAMIRGLQAGGVRCCAKHFPGHGDTAVDSHLGLPRGGQDPSAAGGLRADSLPGRHPLGGGRHHDHAHPVPAPGARRGAGHHVPAHPHGHAAGTVGLSGADRFRLHDDGRHPG